MLAVELKLVPLYYSLTKKSDLQRPTLCDYKYKGSNYAFINIKKETAMAT
jgi:hypothetical protein